MKIPEFIGGLLIGFSIYITVLSTFYLSEIGGGSDVPSKAYLEILIPFSASIIAGIGIGFGLKSDDKGYGFSFSDWTEQWPALIGGLGLAAAFGSAMLLYFSGTPMPGVIYSIISTLLCVGGAILAVLNWETSPY